YSPNPCCYKKYFRALNVSPPFPYTPVSPLIFATNNAHKIAEVASMLNGTEVVSLKEVGFSAVLPEPYHTFRENAESKARAVWAALEQPLFAEDSGISVESLDGAPGVFSARFAGENATDEANLALLEEKMKGKSERAAHYTAVICFID